VVSADLQTSLMSVERESVSVSLARAVYSRASILLLDDVLSAGGCHDLHPEILSFC
jgi:hypothetical protein